MNKWIWKKALAVTLAAVTCSTLLLVHPVGDHHTETKVQAAATIAELEARKKENNKKIQEYETKLSQFSENQKQAEAYQTALQEKINALQNNMQILDTELEGIKKNIYYLDADIKTLEQEMSEQEKRIEKGLEEFKLRIRAMYITGNDSVISALAGATDFYDLLSKYELIACIAKHDDELVNNLKAELEAYEQNKNTLQTQKADLEKAKADKESMQKEMQNSMSELRFAYADSQAEQERLAFEQQMASQSIADLEADNTLADSAEAEIREQIRRAEEERKKAVRTTAAAVKKAVSSTTAVTTAVSEAETGKPNETTVIISEKQTETEALSSAPQTAPVIETAASKENQEENVIKAITTAAPQTTVKATTVTTTTTTVKITTTTEAPTEPETMPETIPETIPDYDETAFGWPCPGYYYISSGFGTRWGTTHKGIDIAQNAGADAVASRAGKVIKINTSCTHNYGKNSNCCGNGYGNYVLIDHEDGTYSTMYAHLQSVIVSVGDYVEKGQTVGYVGTTGWSTGYHLHFEIRKDGVAVNPSNYLNY
ncbi:MAG: peptidoglycan DD-metalloendopeptidase family protein [Oscillospiraceae bacterium]|nr:peptidoglycan DD-metalloendopeptidase family protein [Oscillospiraceae bacterium]